MLGDVEVGKREVVVGTDRLCRVDFYSWGFGSVSLQDKSLESQLSMRLNVLDMCMCVKYFLIWLQYSVMID